MSEGEKVYKIIELVGSSHNIWEEAVQLLFPKFLFISMRDLAYRISYLDYVPPYYLKNRGENFRDPQCGFYVP
ncbi:MAG: dodecin domain-containing protein [Candidatus Heimdallarchaeaceae archaeon]